MAIFVVAPTLMAIRVSVSQVVNYKLVHDFTLSNFQRVFEESIYTDALLRSMRSGLIVAVICVVLSVPLAHFICFRVKRRQIVWFAAVVIALFMGYLLRIIGWRILLGREGVLNELLISVGLIDQPLSFLVFSPFAVILAQAHLAMPFAFIPIFVVMQRLPRALLDAADDLGASRWKQFLYVELPLIAPGVGVGATFAFVLAFGDYFAPILVGNPGSISIGNLASNQFSEALNWPLGAAIGVVMMVTVLVVVALPPVMARAFRTIRHGRAGVLTDPPSERGVL